ncbi:MAG TPA: FUSC family protein [Streptosporangiaceae bacterium]|nr:FUSC family protein [Streptosporangiaceae bacterium]
MASMHIRAARLRQTVAPDWLTEALPSWLTEIVRPHPAPVPWGEMARAALAIGVPLSVGMALGRRDIGLLPAVGGLLGTLIDTGGPYLVRLKRVLTAAVFGGAAGLIVGSVIHGQRWTCVVALVAVAGVSGVLSRLGSTGSVTGLQLLIYSSLGLGPLGALRPWWHTALGFVVGVGWALLLIVPGWLLSPRAAEQRSVAAVYHALAGNLRAIGTDRATDARDAVTAALSTAYDTLLTARATAGGRSRRMMRLMAALNASHQLSEAVVALRREGTRPPPLAADTIDRLADAIAAGRPRLAGPLVAGLRSGATGSGSARPGAAHRGGAESDGRRRDGRRRDGQQAGVPPCIPPPRSDSPGTLALRDAMAGLVRAMAWTPSAPPEPMRPTERGTSAPAALRDRLRRRLATVADQLQGGWIGRTFTIRLMVCVGVAAVMSQVLPLQRSYWVVLTVAIVLKPDYGSVFARALQRGIGTIVGAVLGAAILAVVPYGPLLLIPMAVLAAGLPFGRSRNFGLVATFLTPLVVLLIDLLAPGGWRLALDRLIDTILGCAIVLVVGYAPWPMSWYSHLPRKFSEALRYICRYLEEALVVASPTGQRAASPDAPRAADGAPTADGPQVTESARPASRSRQRYEASRALADLRAEYERTMSEPPAMSRRASAWWPAAVELEEVVDAVTATAVAISRGAPAPSPDAVYQLTDALCGVADAIDAGVPPPRAGDLPADETLKPVTDAVRPVLALLASRDEPGG